jgi:[protein-PII] uridylyltransferase
MNSSALSIKQLIAARTEEIAAGHRGGAGSFATCLSLTAMTDEAIQLAYRLIPSHQDQIAVMAIGGYGRAELCPKSDIDVMILAEDGKSKDDAERIAKTFLLHLWDAGMDVGHSVRTVKDTIALHGKLVDSWASMLESRFLCGNAGLAESFLESMKKQIEKGKDKWFIEGVFDEVHQRHERFGNSVKLLEPNVKKSAGGLRDFQSLFWLYRANDPRYFFPIEPHSPASLTFVDALVESSVLDSYERDVIVKALQFLFRTRHEMHFRRQTTSDGLEYVLQREVAEALGFGGKAELHSVEVFMREYYLHARSIHRLHQNLSHKFREMIETVRYFPSRAEPLGGIFFRVDDMLAVEPEVHRLSSAQEVLEAFSISAEHEIELHVRTRRAITNSLDLFTDEQRRSPECAAKFRAILRSRRVAKTFHDMNDLHVLTAYLPEWGELVAFFQHNMYHYYTADEHTLIAMANAEQLRERQGVLREVLRNLRRKDVLFFAILLHDIAKPRGVADHEITGVDIAREVLHRIGMADVFNDVAFLIRNHLVMEQVAFRRNIHDPATIKEFAAKFDRPEQLDYLYLLTFADLSAVNINVWTEWKSSLLQELYQLTSEVLRRNLKGTQIDEFKQSRHEAAVEALIDRLSGTMPRDTVHEHIEKIGSDAYVALFTDDEIGQHIHKSATDETVSTLFSRQEGHTEITVITEDAPFALSKFCAVLSANDANIFDANIFTRDDGIIIDRFRVSDARTKGELSQTVCSKIAKDLNEVMEGKLDIVHLFEAHRRKWKRRQKPPSNPNIRTDVQFEDNPRYTIIDVYAPDSLGFLYRVTETISRLGLDIHFAKIATRVDGILDAFYVLDRAGNRITEPERQEAIRKEILSTVKQISEQELSSQW